MLSRRKFLASAVAVAVAPSTFAASEAPTGWGIGIMARPEFRHAQEALTLDAIRKMAAVLKAQHMRPIMYKGVPCYRLETSVGRSMIPLSILNP